MKSLVGLLGGVALMAGVAMVAAPAGAAIVTVTFAGVLNPYFGALGGSFSGSVTYDTALADTTQAAQTGITAFSITSPILTQLYGQSTITQSYSGASASIIYSPDLDGQLDDRFELDFSVGTSPQVSSNFAVDVNYALGTFSPDAYGLPTTLPALATAVTSNVVYGNSQGDLSFGPLNSLTISSVESPAPEPATWAMLVLGFGVLGATLRQRPVVAIAAR